MSEVVTPKDELDLLKQQAKLMGIKHHPAIGADKLREKIQEAAQADEADSIQQAEPTQPVSAASRKKTLKDEALKLVRVRVSCMNPNKREWTGELFSVGNALVGQQKKFVPFDNEEGWHIPYIIYQHLLNRKCQIFTTVKGPRGSKVRKGKLIKEFAVEVLPALTSAELKDLARRQAIAAGTEE